MNIIIIESADTHERSKFSKMV